MSFITMTSSSRRHLHFEVEHSQSVRYFTFLATRRVLHSIASYEKNKEVQQAQTF